MQAQLKIYSTGNILSRKYLTASDFKHDDCEINPTVLFFFIFSIWQDKRLYWVPPKRTQYIERKQRLDFPKSTVFFVITMQLYYAKRNNYAFRYCNNFIIFT